MLIWIHFHLDARDRFKRKLFIAQTMRTGITRTIGSGLRPLEFEVLVSQ